MTIAFALLLSLAGLFAAWQAWRAERGGWAPRAWLALALLLWSASTWRWVADFGGEIGAALAIETASLLAFAFVLSRMERQTPRAGRRVRPQARNSPVTPAATSNAKRRWHIAARTLVAGPLGLAAAMSLGLLVALRAPLHEQTRLIVGGLAVPSLWAAMVVLTLARPRVWPQALAFALVVAATALLAWWGYR